MEPVGMTGTSTWMSSESFITAPLPYLRSMVVSAVERASARAASGLTAGFLAMGYSRCRWKRVPGAKIRLPGNDAS